MTIEEILAGESKNVEFKENLPEKSIKYMKSVVAFANGTGGKIIFGIADKTREVVGFDKEDVFKKMDAIANAVSDSCEPAIIPDITLQTVDGKTVIVVEVSEGRQRPYYIKALGRDGGVYVRVAGTTRLADEYMVKELLFEGSNRYYDQALCTGLDITDEDIRASEVSTKIFKALNLNMGYVQRAHCLYQDNEEELDHAVTLLAYDMLFGDDYVYDGQSPVPEVGEKPMIMGLEEIGISRVSNEGDHAVVRGRNFNEYSKVYDGEDQLETLYVDRNTLMVQDQTLSDGALITVKQVDDSGHVLSSSSYYTFH